MQRSVSDLEVDGADGDVDPLDGVEIPRERDVAGQ